MRTTYGTRVFDFGQPPTAEQTPKRIIVHRQGNPGAKAAASLAWGKREGAFTIHSYIGGETCWDAIDPTRHAYHVLEASVAEARGYRVSGAHGRRGDYDSIGIETEDVPGGAPGQAYSLTQATRITLLLRVAAYMRQFPHLTVADIDEHATWDPSNRSEDLGDALNIPDFREDVADLLAGREPWRTVATTARGTRAPVAWKPAPTTEKKPDLEEAQRQFEAAQRALAAGIAAMKGA